MTKRAKWDLFIYSCFLAAGAAIFLHAQMGIEKTMGRMRFLQDEIAACGRVVPMTSRDEVIQAMGKPEREERVTNVTGPATRLWYSYKTGSGKPHVDIDDLWHKVVEIDCASHAKSRWTVTVQSDAKPVAEALPGPSQRQ